EKSTPVSIPAPLLGQAPKSHILLCLGESVILPHTHPPCSSPCPGGWAWLPVPGIANWYVVGLFSVINKECAASCESSFQDFSVGKQNVSCCSTDLCNRSGAGSVGSSYATMAAGLTASVLCVLLRNGL
uniref:Snake toxin/toxin-like domain-containing protein n=1 Tax=Terrapene triunguis TaxID=2587831 RepID=A0A674HTF5_9SAUR